MSTSSVPSSCVPCPSQCCLSQFSHQIFHTNIEREGRGRSVPTIMSGTVDEKLKQTLKNTKCEGVKVNQLFTFFTSIITPNNGGALGPGTSKNVSGISNSSLQYCCDGSFFSILFTFSAIKGLAKELRLSFMSGEKYVNKIFLLFSGSESAKVSPN